MQKRQLSAAEYVGVQQKRAELPMASHRDELLRAIRAHRVVLVCGETGCGKTTQLPQFILEDEIERGDGAMCSIVCTQPRRIAALSVAAPGFGTRFGPR